MSAKGSLRAALGCRPTVRSRMATMPSSAAARTFATSTSARRAAPSTETSDNFVKIVEVSPRDGLQNEKRIIPTETKVELIRRLAGTGLSVIEAGAFVSPKWVPQMGDSAAVLSRLPSVLPPAVHSRLSFPVLVPNSKGLDSLLALLDKQRQQQQQEQQLTDEIAVFTAASDAFTQANTNCTIEESMRRISDVLSQVHSHNASSSAQNRTLKVRAYISVVLGCPYSGAVDPVLVARLTRELLGLGAYEVSLGDTVGVGTPRGVRALLGALEKEGVNVGGEWEEQGQRRARVKGVAAHCHDTFGTGLANVLEFVRGGVRVVDASVSGLGGCPYSPGATGNIDTESVVQALHVEGYETGVDLLKLAQVGQWISDEVRGQGVAQTLRGGDADAAGETTRMVNLNASSAGRAVLAKEARRQQEQQQGKAKL